MRREVAFARRMCRLGNQTRREFQAEFGEPGDAWRGFFESAKRKMRMARESRENALCYSAEGASCEAAAGQC